jgi:hypothetical protein
MQPGRPSRHFPDGEYPHSELRNGSSIPEVWFQLRQIGAQLLGTVVPSDCDAAQVCQPRIIVTDGTDSTGQILGSRATIEMSHTRHTCAASAELTSVVPFAELARIGRVQRRLQHGCRYARWVLGALK